MSRHEVSVKSRRCGANTKKKGEEPKLFAFCPRVLAEWTGLEPATPGVTGRYSNQLNYHSRIARPKVQTYFWSKLLFRTESLAKPDDSACNCYEETRADIPLFLRRCCFYCTQAARPPEGLGADLPLRPKVGFYFRTCLVAVTVESRFSLSTERRWWVLRGSNSRHSPCKGDALPTELSTRERARPALQSGAGL